jgi:hypothetical protein
MESHNSIQGLQRRVAVHSIGSILKTLPNSPCIYKQYSKKWTMHVYQCPLGNFRSVKNMDCLRFSFRLPAVLTVGANSMNIRRNLIKLLVMSIGTTGQEVYIMKNGNEKSLWTVPLTLNSTVYVPEKFQNSPILKLRFISTSWKYLSSH